MKNEHIENIIDRIQSGEKVGKASREIAWAYQDTGFQKFGRICIDSAIHSNEDAVAIAQQLSMVSVKELFITGGWSNQLDAWFAMDAFGLKLRGIVQIENAAYYTEVKRWGSSDMPEMIPALRFSFEEVA